MNSDWLIFPINGTFLSRDQNIKKPWKFFLEAKRIFCGPMCLLWLSAKWRCLFRLWSKVFLKEKRLSFPNMYCSLSAKVYLRLWKALKVTFLNWDYIGKPGAAEHVVCAKTYLLWSASENFRVWRQITSLRQGFKGKPMLRFCRPLWSYNFGLRDRIKTNQNDLERSIFRQHDPFYRIWIAILQLE